jgi:hypothetical protein
MSLLTADQALKVEHRRFGEVELTELGGTLRIASLSADAALQLGELKKKGGDTNEREMMHFLIRNACVDGVGAPLFTAAQTTELIGRMSLDSASTLVEKISGFIGEGLAHRKNSLASPSAS